MALSVLLSLLASFCDAAPLGAVRKSEMVLGVTQEQGQGRADELTLVSCKTGLFYFPLWPANCRSEAVVLSPGTL